jgi:hypothetical protein
VAQAVEHLLCKYKFKPQSHQKKKKREAIGLNSDYNKDSQGLIANDNSKGDQ